MGDTSAMTNAELTALFATLPMPQAMPSGPCRGGVPALPGGDALPPALHRWLLAFVNGPLCNWLWRGKWFDGADEGANYWLFADARLQLARYRCRMEPASGCLVLDYDRSDNPRRLRALRGELRQWRPRTLLGRVRLGPRLTIFFTLEQQAPA